MRAVRHVAEPACLDTTVPVLARCPKYFEYVQESTMKHLLRFIREDQGQDLVEYALLITFIALA